MQRIIITGATGIIGVHLIKEWMKSEVEVFAIVRPNSVNVNRIPIHERIHVLELHMNEYSRLPELIGTANYFYHLAWEGARPPYRDNVEMQLNNYNCSLDAFYAGRKLGCTFFLGAGSQAEYGMTNGMITESTPCNPITEYGKQKLHTYETLKKMADETEMKFIWARIFSVYGPFDFSGTLVMTCIEKMQKNESIEMTTGTQLWDYLYAEDAAIAMVIFAEKDCESGAYNLASGDHRPLRMFVEEIRQTMGSSSCLEFGKKTNVSNETINLLPNSDKIMSNLNWMPSYSFQEGIKKMISMR